MDHAAAGLREGTGTIAPFLTKTYEMVDDPKTDSVVSWSAGNNSFVVWNVPEFQKEFLPKYFKHSNFSSFIRQLNTYGFKKVDPDRYEFANESFLRGQKHLLKNINRKRTVQTQSNQPSQVQNSSAAACVEIGKFGIEEEIDRLKRDKNILMQELVRLRQQQQATDNQLQNVGQRVQVMEQRQQQMMSFLAKAMQSPGFLNQLVQQQNESNRLITGSSKKRRLPGQEEEPFMGVDGPKSPNGQIVKFHSSMNEAAKAMLRQIMKMNSSPRREPSINHSGPLLIDNLPSSSAVEGDNSAARFSGVILSEVPPSSGPASLPLESGHPTSHSSTVFAEVHTTPSLMPDPMITDNAELNVNNFGQDDILANLTEMQEIVPDSSVDVNFGGSGNGDYTDPMSSLLDATMALETNGFPPNQDVDGIPKLPSINDVFWEQFLTTSSPTGDTEETNSSSPESSMTKEQGSQSWQENSWDKIQNMNHLTEQMELLTSASRRG